MSEDKWKLLSAKGISENYQNALVEFGNAEKPLLGLLLGSVLAKTICAVVFLKQADEESLKMKATEILTYLPARIELLGLAKFPNTNIEDFDFDKQMKLSVKLPSPEELKQRNFKKLFDSNPKIQPFEEETLSLNIKDVDSGERNDKLVLVELSFQCGIERDNVKENISKRLSELEKEKYLHPGTGTSIGIFDKESSLVEIVSQIESVQRSPSQMRISLTTDLTRQDSDLSLTLNLAVEVEKAVTDTFLRKEIIDQAKRVFQQAERVLAPEEGKSIHSLRSDAFSPSFGSFRLVHVVISGVEENFDADCRARAHRSLNLTKSLPLLLPSQSLGSETRENSGLITNPHSYVKLPPKLQRMAVVAGKYQYHHYAQDNFEDSGWGCAYRSFQTVWSWFRLQHLTDKTVPSHKEIQQCLCDIGDKPAKFVGSRQWIGSLELSFCLETMMGVSSRILSSKSGAELGEHARAIIFHFENYGAPIMIGGGQLAHTILGVDYNVRSGETRLLILDPHYTGDEDLEVIVKKGWCGWKPTSFFDKKAFYNLLLPIVPKVDI